MAVSLRERRKQLLGDEILDAARNLLGQKGYVDMSMDDLAAHVGISKPTLYSHFATKDKLVAAAIERELKQLVALLQSNQEQRTPLQRLSLLHQTIIQFHLEEGMATLRPIMPELKHIVCENNEVLGCLKQLHSVVVGLVQAGMKQGEIDETLDQLSVVRVFFALLGALRPPPFDVSDTPNLRKLADTLTLIFARGIRPQQR